MIVLVQLYSAGLDVFPDEPKINPLLTANPRLTLLPHMGTESTPHVPVVLNSDISLLILPAISRGVAP